MSGMVAIDLAFDNLVILFGLCGGWGMTFVCYFIPSLIGLAASEGKSVYPLRTLAGVTTIVYVWMQKKEV